MNEQLWDVQWHYLDVVPDNCINSIETPLIVHHSMNRYYELSEIILIYDYYLCEKKSCSLTMYFELGYWWESLIVNDSTYCSTTDNEDDGAGEKFPTSAEFGTILTGCAFDGDLSTVLAIPFF